MWQPFQSNIIINVGNILLCLKGELFNVERVDTMLLGLVKSDQDKAQDAAINSYISLLVNGCKNNGLTPSLINQASSLAINNGLSIKQLIKAQKSVFENAWNAIAEDGEIDDTEFLNFNKLLNICSGLPDEDKTNYRKIIMRYHTFYDIKNNHKLPVYTSSVLPIRLRAGEIIHYVGYADMLKTKKVTTRVNYRGPTSSIRIWKGFYYRMGSIKVQRETKDVLVKDDENGFFWITNKRIGYLGTKKTFSVLLNKLMAITGGEVGVLIYKEGRASPFNLNLYDPDMSLTILSEVLNRTSVD
jgi:hypothetical protein